MKAEAEGEPAEAKGEGMDQAEAAVITERQDSQRRRAGKGPGQA